MCLMTLRPAFVPLLKRKVFVAQLRSCAVQEISADDFKFKPMRSEFIGSFNIDLVFTGVLAFCLQSVTYDHSFGILYCGTFGLKYILYY